MFILPLLAVTVCFPKPVEADVLGFNPADYYTYSYSLELNKTVVKPGESVVGLITASATCIKDPPIRAQSISAEGSLVAIHSSGNPKLTMVETYSITVALPRLNGTVTKTYQFTYQFPAFAVPGTYSISGKLIGAYVDVSGIRADITSELPQSVTLGSIKLVLPTRIEITSPNSVSPGQEVTLTASVCLLPGLDPANTAGMPVTFDYVLYKLESGVISSGQITSNTDNSGKASMMIKAPNEKSMVLVDAVFLGYNNYLASSGMKIIAVLPFIEARLTATTTEGVVTFHLEDQYGKVMKGQMLSFQTTEGSLSNLTGVTDTEGNVSVSLSGISLAVVSASFGGYIDSSGWSYQPTMTRITT